LGRDGQPGPGFAARWNGETMQGLRERIGERRNPAFCRACYPGWSGG